MSAVSLYPAFSVSGSQQSTSTPWTVSSSNGELTVSFKITSDQLKDILARIPRKSLDEAILTGSRLSIDSPKFNFNGVELYLSLKCFKDLTGDMLFSLEKVNFQDQFNSPSKIHYHCVLDPTAPRDVTLSLNFSDQKSMEIVRIPRIDAVSKAAVELKISFLK